MSFPPLPGQAGIDIMETVSQKAFDAWKLHQTTLINERRLDLSIAELSHYVHMDKLQLKDNFYSFNDSKFFDLPYFLCANSILSLASIAKTIDSEFEESNLAVFPTPVPASKIIFLSASTYFDIACRA